MTVVTTSEFIKAVYDDMATEVETVPAKRPNKRGQQTRERLVRAAVECFTEYGYSRTRISDIVHRAGTAQGNFYRHFASLDQIFLAVIRPGLEELAASTKRSAPSASLEGLVEANTRYLRAYARNRHLMRLLQQAAAVNPGAGFEQVWLRLRSVFTVRTVRWLEHLHEAGEVGDADFEMVAELLGCLTDQLSYVHIGLPSKTPRPERIDELGRALGEAWFKMLPPPA